ncbi:MAG: hypothetical protein U1F43_22380 [Myxococcota bacterium]
MLAGAGAVTEDLVDEGRRQRGDRLVDEHQLGEAAGDAGDLAERRRLVDRRGLASGLS